MIYDTVIIGSGYYSTAYALNHKNTLIIEKTQLLDPNFCGRLCRFDMSVSEPESADAKALWAAFHEEGLLKDGRIAVNELEPALCRFVQGKNLNILLGTFCLNIQKSDAFYELEICSNEGIQTLYAKNVIDATVPWGNRLNFLVCAKQQVPPKVEGISRAFYPDQFRISVSFDGITDINEAKKLALETYEAALIEADAPIILMAYRLDGAPVQQPYTDEKGVLHIDERAFGDLFTAYEKGECYDGTFHS